MPTIYKYTSCLKSSKVSNLVETSAGTSMFVIKIAITLNHDLHDATLRHTFYLFFGPLPLYRILITPEIILLSKVS